MTALSLASAAVGVGLLVLPAGRRAGARLRGLGPAPREAMRSAKRGLRLVPRWPGRRPANNEAYVLLIAASWDLLAACLRAGMPVADALRAVARGLPEGIATGLRRTSDLIALGAGPDEAWRPALDCPDTAELGRAARRSARSGTALAGVAADLAVRMRAELTDLAEARAQRAGVLITGPLGLCFLPGFLCLGVVPVVIGLAGQLTGLH